ncbi:MipA/OmpV family protein [Vibrio tubiashii]|uniref:MltA-interacting MipA family protein n=1 Tax=Vibrio tubiashii ATCC 19109 TaxID=1051646 RepID=F9T6D6_9VIBR|nr:MipA/OmpV family protein [Vibrio tubiashii]AIW16709.1 hypothetical protein IX91_21760 [Vibrio tubiashii ATCC 19109]EGU54599.1 hypothetical protein VITU9109_13616 [Vibrio tubiashii ATCC 19109]EIF02055.1 hypothetical protein VT1337_20027 [Vibrio tubiashii NCIMB 1337 = ATCC 19106]
MKPILNISLFCLLILAKPSYSSSEHNWGVAAAVRTADIPFDTQQENDSVSTFIPLMYFENDHINFTGQEIQLKLLEHSNKVRLNAISKLRHIDIPHDYQNYLGGVSLDYGIQGIYNFDNHIKLKVDVLNDIENNKHTNLALEKNYRFDRLEVEPYLSIRFKDSQFNSSYYGAGLSNLSSSHDYSFGFTSQYRMSKYLYLLGSLNHRVLDKTVRKSTPINSESETEFYVGFGIFEFNKQKNNQLKRSNSKSYIRVAQGFATPSDMSNIVTLNVKPDENNNQLTSIFYGHHLTDNLFDYPIDVYISPGVAHHWSSSVQESSTEIVTLIKAYYTLNHSVRMRLGAGNGLSYVDKVPYIEHAEMSRKNKEVSHLMNYIDLSYDLNLGDLFNSKQLKDAWFGYSLHHRSAIFGTASQFGRITGGSNYNSLYLQFHF